MLYRNCRELPIHNFNEIEVTGDLTYLIKEGNHDEKELEKHWIDILDEAITLSKDQGQTKFFRDKAELLYLETKLKVLSGIGYIVNLEISEAQKKDIDSLLKKYRVTNIEQSILETTDKINLKISQFKRVYNIEKNSNFDSVLAIMRMRGYHINKKEISVSEFYALVDEMKKQNVAQRNASRKKRTS